MEIMNMNMGQIAVRTQRELSIHFIGTDINQVVEHFI